MEMLLKNARLFAPEDKGRKDILIKDGVVVKIEKNIDCSDQVIDCSNKVICPMFVDGHEHFVARGFNVSKLFESGVAVAVGVLSDGDIEIVGRLQNKTNVLRQQGVNAYYLAGSKGCRKDIKKTIVENEFCVGTKTALNSTSTIKPENPTYEEFKKLSVETYEAGLETNKSVQVHVHLEIEKGGLDKTNMSWIDKVVEETGVPYSLFKLTHAQKYGKGILQYAAKGCYLDYTAMDGQYYPDLFDSLVEAIKNKEIDVNKISFSSDWPWCLEEMGKDITLGPIPIFTIVRRLSRRCGLEFTQVLPMITTNAAAQINNELGRIIVGKPAKMVVLDEELRLTSIINGEKQLEFNQPQPAALGLNKN